VSAVADNDSSRGWSEATLGRFLCDLGIWDDAAPAIEPAGDGNINWVRRLRSHASGRTLIVKHARPALERFPQYVTSTERIVFENRYYEFARGCDPDGVCPTILHFDEERRLLVLEDLGRAERLDAALLRGADVGAALAQVAAFLGRIHAATCADDDLAGQFANGDMQRLHGDHIFELPYVTDFEVPDGVRVRASEIRADATVREISARAYQRYLEPRGALVHADVQPGNILLRGNGPTLLDAEIAHVGDPAFDVGTLLAHVWLGRLAARGPVRAISPAQSLWAGYTDALGTAMRVPFSDVARYAGLEMMRRTIGAARVAAVASAEASLAAIDIAERFVRQPPSDPKEIELP